MPSAPLWTAPEIARATGGHWLVPPPEGWAPKRVSYDVTGNMAGQFCVLVHPASWGAARRDPTADIARLARQGAAGIMVERGHLETLAQQGAQLPPGLPVLLVASTWTGLQDMAQIARMRFRGKLFAVTGTVGKTTTREMIRHLTHLQGGATASAANNNNISGVHRSLAYMPRENAAGVIEMGFGKPLDGIERSSRIAQPDVAVLTTIDVAHFDMFTPKMLETARGSHLLLHYKMQILAGLVPGGAAVINADLPESALARAFAERRTDRVYGFGTAVDADARLGAAELDIAGSRAQVTILGRPYVLHMQVPGRHMLMNALAALLAVGAAGFDLDQAVADMARFEPVAGRARVVQASLPGGGSATIIDDSFNATLASMRSSIGLLQLARPGAGGRRIAVLGEIGHVGATEAEEHRALAEFLAESGTDLVFSWGPLMGPMFEALPVGLRGAHEDSSVEALYQRLRPLLRDGDVVTVKSGRGTNGLGDIRFRKFVEHLVAGKAALVL
ncbi:MAG: Mur ligase family protein [Paracoccaceae bacterium]|nr:Mur ligase family protein [Paracoccaceae bacterium]